MFGWLLLRHHWKLQICRFRQLGDQFPQEGLRGCSRPSGPVANNIAENPDSAFQFGSVASVPVGRSQLDISGLDKKKKNCVLEMTGREMVMH